MTNERPENVWATTLPNGLRVRVLCKPDFQRSYAVFATCYGGCLLYTSPSPRDRG